MAVKAGMKITFPTEHGPVPAIVMVVNDETVEVVSLYAIGHGAREALYDRESDAIEALDPAAHPDTETLVVRALRLAHCESFPRVTQRRDAIEWCIWEHSSTEVNDIRNAKRASF